jgi:16S rRNA (guanine527-N7)-methyltransferase
VSAGVAPGGAAGALLAGLPDAALQRLKIYERLLKRWQRAINLVGTSTLEELWIRHFADSLQVADAVPGTRRWLDLGSGAGFPGLVTAIRLAGEASAAVHLVESNRRKCAFLREAARETGAPAIVHCGRIEDILPTLDGPFDAVSARALAPLETLIGHAEKFLLQGAVGVFPKGKGFLAELTPSLTEGKYAITAVPSKTDPDARLIVVRQKLGVNFVMYKMYIEVPD